MNSILKFISAMILVCPIRGYSQTLWLPADSLNQPRLQTAGSFGPAALSATPIATASLRPKPSIPQRPLGRRLHRCFPRDSMHAVAGLQNGKVLVAGGFVDTTSTS